MKSGVEGGYQVSCVSYSADRVGFGLQYLRRHEPRDRDNHNRGILQTISLRDSKGVFSSP